MAVTCEQSHLPPQLTDEEFEGQVPTLLQFLNCEIHSEHILQSQQGTGHRFSRATSLTRKDHAATKYFALVRWEHGYEIGQILFEWAQFNITLTEILNEYEANYLRDEFCKAYRNSVNTQFISTVRMLTAQLCDAGYLQIVAEYQRLQRDELNGTLQRVSQALQQEIQWGERRGQLLRETIHDLRGNLLAVQSAAGLIDSAPPEVQSSVSCLLQRGIDTLYQMLNQLLDLSRLESGHEIVQSKTFDVALLLQQLCQSTKPLAQAKGLSLVYRGASKLEMEGDAVKVQRIAQNLLLNAVKYTERGEVTIECAQLDEARWFLRITDTGSGLSLPQPDSNSSHGEGVGLEIVRKLCKLLKAKLEIKSEEQEGTSIQITWPCVYNAKSSSMNQRIERLENLDG